MIRAPLALTMSFMVLVADVSRAQPPAPTPPRCAEGATSIDASVLEAAARAYGHEPTVAEVVRAALDALETSPADARRARRRGRRSGLVPTLRVGATRARGIDLETDTNGAPTDIAQDADLRIDGQLSFDLGRLVYGPDEIAWSRELRSIESVRETRARDVVELYFRRRRLQIERDFLCDCSTENALEIAQAQALLDVFTAGAFSRIIDERARESPDARATSAHTSCRSGER